MSLADIEPPSREEAEADAHQVLDAEDVIAALTAGLEAVEVWLVDGTGTMDDRLRVLRLVDDWRRRGGRLSEALDHVRSSIAADLPTDEPRQVDGQWWRAKRKPRRTGFDKDGLRSVVNRAATAPVADVSPDGEVVGHRDPTVAEAIEVVWKAADVATGRTAVLRDTFGVDLDEYATTKWDTTVEAVDENEIPPDQRGAEQ